MKINQYGSTAISTTPTRSDERRTSGANRGASGATVSISSEARVLEHARARVSSQPDIRDDKVQEARQALLTGGLDGEDALETAVDHLIPDLF